MTEEADSNLYVNPLESAEKCVDSTMNEHSKVSLNDVVPKHRKLRIQQVDYWNCEGWMGPMRKNVDFQSARHRSQSTINENENTSGKEEETEGNNNYYYGLRGGRGTSNSMVSSTRIINHHLFGNVPGIRHNSSSGKLIVALNYAVFSCG